MRKQWLLSLPAFLIAATAIILATTTISAAPPAQSNVTPVLLIHGFCGDVASWDPIVQTLQENGHTVEIVDFGDSANGDIKEYAQQLDQFVQQSDTLFDKEFDIVAHSMGGLISRYYIANYDNNVQKLILIGSPNLGTKWASIPNFVAATGLPMHLVTQTVGPRIPGWCKIEESPAAEQMSPGSDFLKELNAKPAPQTVNIYSIIGRKNTPYGLLKAGDGVVSVESASLPHYPLYQTLDNHISYKSNPKTIQLITHILQEQNINLASFEYWPLAPSGNAIRIADVPEEDKPGFLKNRVTSDFGFRNVSKGTTYHPGIDIQTSSRGITVTSVMSGTVVSVFPSSGIVTSRDCAANVVVYHPAINLYTRYLHLLTINVSKGQVITDTTQQFIGTSGPPVECENRYPKHLHFEVIPDWNSWTINGPISNYLNPLAFFTEVNLDTPKISEIGIRTGDAEAYIPLSDVEAFRNGALELGSQDIWLRFKVLTDDRDIDSVSIWIDGKLLHFFDYYAGTKRQNNSMPRKETITNSSKVEAFVSTGSLRTGIPSEDWFYYHLYSPDDKRMQNLLGDVQYHMIYIRAIDALGNDNDPAEGSFWIWRWGPAQFPLP